jgi:3-oxoacyl-[acyl-carrier protein] reductase
MGSEMTGPFESRAALVTGAGRGIGKATALGLAEAGAAVVLVARSEDQLNEVAVQINEQGGIAHLVPADLGDPDQVNEVVERTLAHLGAVDIVINNAAVVSPIGPSASQDPVEWASAIRVNVIAPATLSLALLPAMIGRKWGRIVNVSSSIAVHPDAMIGMNAYAASKAALEAHTVNLAAELDGSGVTVNVYRPGSVDTAMHSWIRAQDPADIGADLHQWFIDSHQRGSLITPEQSAQSLLARLPSSRTGEVWDASDPL